MDAISLLKLQAGLAYAELQEIIAGIEQPLAWAVAPLKEGEYLHDTGSIHGVVMHLAECKVGYASTGFRNLEIRQRDILARMEAVGSDWNAAKKWLEEAQAYWLDCWAHLTPEDLEKEVPIHGGRTRAIWKIISTMSCHDSYHAGQIELLKSTLSPTDVEPPSMADLTRPHVVDLPEW
jgi:uncharacterized damage-inducible protein DinB